MNKEINELDRMTIGVREWAVQTVLNEGWKWIGDGAEDSLICSRIPSLEVALTEAAKLEEYVLKETKS